MTKKQKLEQIFMHLIKRIYMMKVTKSNVSMTALGGPLYIPYDVALDFISEDGIVYSFGLGDEITLEIDLLNRGCEIYGYDPMQKSEEFVKSCNVDQKKFHFKRCALLGKNGENKCFYSDNPDTISGSLRKEGVYWQKLSEEYFMVECYNLATLMKMNNHNHIDYLKLCVEGAELEVISEIIEDKLDIDQISLALCGRKNKNSYEKEKQIYNMLIEAGYECLPYNYPGKITFIKKTMFNKNS